MIVCMKEIRGLFFELFREVGYLRKNWGVLFCVDRFFFFFNFMNNSLLFSCFYEYNSCYTGFWLKNDWL